MVWLAEEPNAILYFLFKLRIRNTHYDVSLSSRAVEAGRSHR
jgi:hypothetical protein